MSVIDEVIAANQEFAKTYHPSHFTPRPRLHLAVLTCMDTRLTIASLGLKVGDAHILRNAGGLITEDSIRSILLSHFFLGSEELMIINHTDCGLMKAPEDELRESIVKETGCEAVVPTRFHAFTDLEKSVRQQLLRFRSHPWIGNRMPARGFVYDVENGRLREVLV
jgi:carbonic anhydrase